MSDDDLPPRSGGARPDPAGAADAALDEAARLRADGRFAEARDRLRARIAEAPDDARAIQHLGALLGQLGDDQGAETALRRALTLAPRDAAARHSLAGILMMTGRYPEAWSYYDARFDLPELAIPRPRDFPFPQWRSFHVAGRHILVFPEQGHGDQIQFARFAPQLAAQGARVTMLVSPALARLFTESFSSVRVIAATGAVEFADPDFWIMAADLPGLAQATPATLPRAPYLTARSVVRDQRRDFRVGVMVRGNPAQVMDARRSLTVAAADRLRARLPGVVISLAPEDSGAADFADTAAIIAGLDLVVSVDTAVAHLAGALGVPCLVLIRGFAPDWRWGRTGDEALWYPSMRLFRGTPEGSWDEAIDRLVGEARRRAGMT